MSRRVLAIPLLTALILAISSARAQTPFVYDGEPLAAAIADIEARSDWRFLYRDALVAGKRLHVRTSDDDLPASLARSLAPQGIGVDADPERRQIVLVPSATALSPTRRPAVETTRRVRGRVVDAETGEPLPFATVTWAGGRQGVVCDADGAFDLTLRGDAAHGRTLLTASFAGYEAEQAAPSGTSLTFRLRSPALSTAPIVIAAPLLESPLDSVWTESLRGGGGIGEGGGLRALEALPAVAPAALFADETIVRGSPADAFEIRLDGIPIYNPRHLFGLADAFNPDALRAVALHYGVAPARAASPPGGALDYVTSPGSVRRPRVQAGLSSLAVRAAVDGPLRPGRTSAHLAGRASTLQNGFWSLGDDLVALGLGAETRTSELPQNAQDPLDLAVEVAGTEARFGDLHLALADERASGQQTRLTAYVGGDETSLDAVRARRLRDSDAGSEIVRVPVATWNRWGSGALGLDDRRTLGGTLLRSRLGLSLYSARFSTDDFVFRRTDGVVNPLVFPVDTLGYTNALREGIASVQADLPSGGGVLAIGGEAHLYRVRYDEQVADRALFEREQTAARLDLHGSWAGRLAGGLTADLGVRGHVYSAGTYIRIAPRLRMSARLTPDLSVSAGLGRTHQFVHRLTLDDVPAAAAWVLSAADEPPTEADQLEAALHARAGPIRLDVAAYTKRTRHLRQHAESATGRRLRDSSLLALPWISDVDARSRGAEAMAWGAFGPLGLRAVYACARTDLQHPDLADGEPFRADWDRRHRVTVSSDLALGPVTLESAWTWASGTPNPLAAGILEAASLPDLRRLDLRATLVQAVGSGRLAVSLSIRNALGEDIVLTRDRFTLLQTRPQGRSLVLRPLDVYDVGRLPTFDLSLAF